MPIKLVTTERKREDGCLQSNSVSK